jgi:hypothetical protein
MYRGGWLEKASSLFCSVMFVLGCAREVYFRATQIKDRREEKKLEIIFIYHHRQI